jgi:outer membrane protein TolC
VSCFRSRELTDLMEQAQAANLDIAAAVARIVEANANARVVGATLLPNANLTGNASHSKPSTFDLGSGVGDSNIGSSGGGGAGSSSSSGSGGAGEFSFSSLALNANYVVDFGGRNRALQRAAEFSASASRFNREVVALTILVSIANTYFLVLEVQDLLDTARKNLKASEGILELIQERFDSGTASALDVAQQASLVAIARASIPPLVHAATERTGGGSQARGCRRQCGGRARRLLPHHSTHRAGRFPELGSRHAVRSGRRLLHRRVDPDPIFDGGTLLGQFDLQKGTREELLQSYRKRAISAFTDLEKEWPHGARLIA